MKKDGFILYVPQMKALASILTDEQLGRLMRLVLAYQESGQEPTTIDNDLAIAWVMLKVQFQQDEDKYLEVCKKRREAGKKGGQTRVANASKCNQMQANGSKCKQEQANQADKDKEKEKDKDKEKDLFNKPDQEVRTATQKRFVKPTLEEVRAYCQERRKGVDPERWYNYYESNGWKVGSNPMKDWKAAVRTWEGSQYERRQAPAQMSPDINAVRYGNNKF